ncbi:hypothetical protein E2C01_101497 [Portunus trituberculatus]|uniref:Uncharacterized protein n=1 Tax=Portunus trituberculatus TaxID=210409 RepID=A0A5B7KG81_PORTR|nr:hypothetical protein [Portunus trituberculatus]
MVYLFTQSNLVHTYLHPPLNTHPRTPQHSPTYHLYPLPAYHLTTRTHPTSPTTVHCPPPVPTHLHTCPSHLSHPCYFSLGFIPSQPDAKTERGRGREAEEEEEEYKLAVEKIKK